MKHIRSLAAAVAILGVPLAAMNSASADTVCERTAERMFQSCSFEIKKEFKATRANCINFSDAEERADCRDQAAETKSEDADGCDDQRSARRDVCELLGENRYDPDPLTGESLTGDPIVFVDPDTIGGANLPNPYLSLVPGQTQVLRAGEDFEETIVVHVTDQVREILGVSCRVVVDIVVFTEEDEGDFSYDAVEVTDDWYAQSTDGDVYYCGEIARNFEDGARRDLDGSFEAGHNFAKAGVLIRAAPAAGDAHRQEWSLGEAEDVIRYVDVAAIPTEDEGGENPSFPCAPSGCAKTEEFIPPEPASGEFKYFLAGTGFVLGIGLEDGELTGERDELVCTGAALDVLSDASCGIDDPDALLAELCKLSPDAFCEDE